MVFRRGRCTFISGKPSDFSSEPGGCLQLLPPIWLPIRSSSWLWRLTLLLSPPFLLLLANWLTLLERAWNNFGFGDLTVFSKFYWCVDISKAALCYFYIVLPCLILSSRSACTITGSFSMPRGKKPRFANSIISFFSSASSAFFVCTCWSNFCRFRCLGSVILFTFALF